MKFPAVFLSFDDIYIDAWYERFINSGIKVTFNPTNLEDITDMGWERLRELEATGHTIGFHGVHHLRAGEGIRERGIKKFLEYEILPGLQIYEERGLKRPQHYVYPRGNRTPDSDAALLAHFRTIRAGGVRAYAPEELRRESVIQAANWRLPHNSLIEKAVRIQGAAFVYLHVPLENRIADLLSFEKKGITFYPMGALDA